MTFLMTLLSDYTVQIVLLGTSILGIVSGALGSFAVLRKQSLLGDAIAHASLPGICGAFLLSGVKDLWILLLGALIAGWLGSLIMTVIGEYTRLKRDAALGIVLSVFFGFGLVLLTIIQKQPLASQSGLDTFIFGNASTLLYSDIKTMWVLSAVVLSLLILFWPQFKLITFDAEYARAIGIHERQLQLLLTTLIVLAIIIGLQSVGVVLMSAMIIAPAVSARQWTDNLAFMVCLSALIGMCSGAIGALISSQVPHLPTGPSIVLVVSSIVIVSLLFAPNRGIIIAKIKRHRYSKGPIE